MRKTSDPILDELITNDKRIVVTGFTGEPLREFNRNVICYDLQGNELWRIEPWISPIQSEPVNPWVGVRKQPDGSVRVINIQGFSMALSLENGSIHDYKPGR